MTELLTATPERSQEIKFQSKHGLVHFQGERQYLQLAPTYHWLTKLYASNSRYQTPKIPTDQVSIAKVEDLETTKEVLALTLLPKPELNRYEQFRILGKELPPYTILNSGRLDISWSGRKGTNREILEFLKGY